ncbi:MAG TPA: ATP-binding protein [Bryobacteraceae bacterium]|jgi:signal transduction histidine kinase|nr:ATP-binding protein [Bryobacteraceae bacterium]
MAGPTRNWRHFRDWPIKRKLLAVIVVTTTIALGLATIGIIIVDTEFFRHTLERELFALSQIVADNVTGQLAFEDPEAAAQTLAALRARPHLVATCIYRLDGSVLARYSRADTDRRCPDPQRSLQVWDVPDGIAISRPVVLENKPLGTLTLLYDLGEIRQRRVLYGGTVLLILVVSTIFGAVFSSRLRDKISVPIVRLVETATSVSKSNDYSLRAQKLTGDEMGTLVDAFNDMLARVQSRDDELRQLLKDREEANRELVRLNEDLERFAFVASHDLQEPLRMITVYTQLLQRRSLLDSSPQSNEYVANIVNGARRMRELLDDLRIYAELGGPGDPVVRVDMNQALAKATDNLSLTIESSGAEITSNPLPTINAYEAHLVQLFQNLIGNAIKYRSESTPRICVDYSREKELRFSISDNGIGIAPEFHDRIFVPFKRLHGANIPGSGIGLSICKRVVERYGGRIWVESHAGAGATFHFAFPESLLATPVNGRNSP